MHYSLFIPVTPITFEIIDKWCWWYFCQKMFFYFFSIFRLQSVLFQSGNTILFHRHLKDGEEERRKTKNIWTENTLWYWEFIFAVLLNPFQNAIYQCNQYLRVNGYVMTDDLKTCVFPANKKKPWGLYRDIKFGKDLLVDATTTTYMRLPFMGKKQYVVQHIYTQHCREWFYMLFWPWYIPQYKKLC